MAPAEAIAEMRRTLGADNGPADPFREIWAHTDPSKRAQYLGRVLSPARACEQGSKPGGLHRATWRELAPEERAAVKVLIARDGAPGVQGRTSRE